MVSVIRDLQQKNLIHLEQENNTLNVYLEDLYEEECKSAEYIAEMMRSNEQPIVRQGVVEDVIDDFVATNGFHLEKEQEDAVKNAFKYNFSVITGGPGTGKTTIIRMIIDAWNDTENLYCLAPTGKAAKRMMDATDQYASTIHRWLAKAQYDVPENSLIIVDESSMLDLTLFYRILHNIDRKTCRVILVGDIDQLPSIGPGKILKDLLDSGVIPCSRLKLSHRFGGVIARNADFINKGLPLKTLVLNDPKFMRYEMEKDDIPDKVVQEYKKAIASGLQLKEICCLAPFRSERSASPSSTERLNKLLREELNPVNIANPFIEGVDVRMGDRVMCTTNMAKKPVRNSDGTYGEGVFNGDCGVVTGISPDDNEIYIQLDNDSETVFNSSEAKNNLTLAYAISIHKSQGSEYKLVILVISSECTYMLDRSLLYTGVTRAKDSVIILGQDKTIGRAIWKTDKKNRNTRLAIRVNNAVFGKSVAV